VPPDFSAVQCHCMPIRFRTAEPTTSRHGLLLIAWLVRRRPRPTCTDGVFGKCRVLAPQAPAAQARVMEVGSSWANLGQAEGAEVCSLSKSGGSATVGEQGQERAGGGRLGASRFEERFDVAAEPARSPVVLLPARWVGRPSGDVDEAKLAGGAGIPESVAPSRR
jgi:hypothetical protein